MFQHRATRLHRDRNAASSDEVIGVHRANADTRAASAAPLAQTISTESMPGTRWGPPQVLAFQRLIGNRAVQRTLRESLTTVRRDDEESWFSSDETAESDEQTETAESDTGGGFFDEFSGAATEAVTSGAEAIVSMAGEAAESAVDTAGAIASDLDPATLSNDIKDGGIPGGTDDPGSESTDPTPDPSSQQSSEPNIIRFTLAADNDTKGGGVGHAWIIVEEPGKSVDSWGFWPSSEISGAWDLPTVWGGRVHHPDTDHTPSATMTTLITKSQLDRALAYATSNQSHFYSLVVYNCTHFAREMWAEATGSSAPSGGWLVDDPKDLHDSITKDNEEQGFDSTEQPLPSTDES